MASWQDNSDVLALLLSKGADIEAKASDDSTPLHFVAGSNRGGTESLELLLAKGANLNATDETGLTPLHSAVQSKNKDRVKLLLDKGANVNARDEDDRTPLHFAGTNEPMVKLLIGQGAQVSSIQLAAAIGDMEEVRRSLEQGTPSISAASWMTRR
jgi:ankyrin repeat protein